MKRPINASKFKRRLARVIFDRFWHKLSVLIFFIIFGFLMAALIVVVLSEFDQVLNDVQKTRKKQ